MGLKRAFIFIMIMMLIVVTMGCNEKSMVHEEKKADDIFIEPEYVRTLYKVKEDLNQSMDIKSCGHMELTTQGDIVVYDLIENKYIILGSDQERKGEISCEDLSSGNTYTLDSKDQLYIVDQEIENNKKEEIQEIHRKIIIYDLQGKKQREIPIDDQKLNAKNQSSWYSDIEVDKTGNIYVLSMGERIDKLDSSGKVLGTMQIKNSVFIELDGEEKVWVGGDSPKSFIYQVDIESNQIKKKIEDDNLKILSTGYYASDQKTLYVGDREGIKQYDHLGNYIGDVIRFAATDLPDMVIGARQLLVNEKKEVYITLFDADSSNYKGMKLTIGKEEPKAQSEDQVTISIAIPGLDKFLETAINRFGKKYPNIHFVIKESEEDTSVQTNTDMTQEELDAVLQEADRKYSDYIKKLTTEIIAGKGADIIFIGKLPYYQLIDKNILENLDPFMEKDSSFHMEDYNQDILNGMRYKGDLYVAPLAYQLPVIAVQREMLHSYPMSYKDQNWTWKDFGQFLEKLKMDSDGDGKKDLYTMPMINIQNFFVQSIVIPYSANKLINFEKKEVNFDTPEFVALLKLYKKLVDEKKMNDQVVYQNAEGDGKTWMEPRFIYNYAISIGSTQSELKGNLEILKYPTFDGSEEVPFSTNMLFGINHQSTHKEECWSFIKYLLGEDMQTYEYLYGLPVLNSAKQKIQKEGIEKYEKYREFFESDAGVPLDPIAEVVDRINQLDQKVGGSSNVYDVHFEEITSNELQRFSQGEQTAEETAQEIQRKLWMYLNE